ncbi:MAG: LPS assembly lipoprotein LptE [Woeseiaceae bacterium]|nr:LPS assembly lipoprotein LptE [Woeseiaceae bacterium]
MSRLAALVAVTLLAGCGFQLQGELVTPTGMEKTYIEAVERNSQFHRELRRQLMAAGVEVVDSPAEATAVFAVTSDNTGQRVLSVSARNVPTEYEVFYTVEYSLVSGSQTLLAPQALTFTRDYTWDETLVLGKAREEDLLRESIVRDLVRTVLKQISSL